MLNRKKNISANKIRNELIKYYKKDKFINILKLNSEIGSGNVLTQTIVKFQFAKLKLKINIVIFSAIDNLIKGASGQAIQNMNLMYNFRETLGFKMKKYFDYFFYF